MTNDYERLKQLAREKRAEYGVTTKTLDLNVVNKIYRDQGIRIDRWPTLSRRMRAVYMSDEDDASVMLNDKLPRVPRLFTLVHELKHHLVDRPILAEGQIPCGDYNANRTIEVGAEVFGAEFIYPEAEFLELVKEMGLGHAPVTPEQIVLFKRAAPTTVSYQFLQKRFERFGLAPLDRFAKVQFAKLEEQMFGQPIYKQAWFRELRARRARAKTSAR